MVCGKKRQFRGFHQHVMQLDRHRLLVMQRRGNLVSEFFLTKVTVSAENTTM